MKRNREECKELARLAEKVVSTVVEVTRDMPRDELDEKMKGHIAELERCFLIIHCTAFTVLIIVYVVAIHRDMNEIVETMTHLKDKPVWRRFLRQAKHSDALAKHKQRLEHAPIMFLVSFLCILVAYFLTM